MGAGKTTLGRQAAQRLGRPFYDVDDEIEQTHGPIWELFAQQGEPAFRELEARFAREAFARPAPSVVALGGGAVETRSILDGADVHVVHIDVDVDTAWSRVQNSRRPLAQDEGEFRRRYDARRPLYESVADAQVRDVDGIVLAAAGIVVEPASLQRVGALVPGDGAVELVGDPNVLGIHGMDAQLALGRRLTRTHELPAGEEAKTLTALDRLWQELRLDRQGTLVALGGGCTTDAAGFAAATYLRGIDWVAVPTSLVAQVDAAIGGKTAIDLPQGKNLVGAFHWPARTVIDPSLLQTLPEQQWREGMAEVVKTSLLAGENLHVPLDVRRCAAFKAAVCLRDPHDAGERKQLNLGHTFAHALEAAAGYRQLTHGQAVALGLKAALQLSGRDTSLVDEILKPRPVKVDRGRAWTAMQRDKKNVGGELRLVLLGAGGPEWDVPVPGEDVRRALDSLIAG